MLKIVNELDYLRLAVFEVDGLSVWSPSPELDLWVESQLQAAAQLLPTQEWEARREGVRALLRTGGYKASGRNKPAHEYLARCLGESKFPRIHPAVDCLNALSVRIGLPISMLDRSRFEECLHVRLGKAQERYVFNSVGQELELENLIVVCGGTLGEIPLGSPVKDSMAGKIQETISRIVCILYAPQNGVSESQLQAWSEELRESILRFAVTPPASPTKQA